MTLCVARTGKLTATHVRPGKAMFSVQGSALVNQVQAKSVLKYTPPCVARMEGPTATPVLLGRTMSGVKESAPADQGSVPRSMPRSVGRMG